MLTHPLSFFVSFSFDVLTVIQEKYGCKKTELQILGGYYNCLECHTRLHDDGVLIPAKNFTPSSSRLYVEKIDMAMTITIQGYNNVLFIPTNSAVCFSNQFENFIST